MKGINVLPVNSRSLSGKKASKKLARIKKIPAIYYHKAEENIALEIEANVFQKFINTGHSVITLDIDDGKNTKEAILKKIQYDPVKNIPIHVDFMGITKGVKIRTEVPIHIVGNAPGLKKGGFLEHELRSIEVECLPKFLPESITVDVSNMDLGQSIHVGDIKIENVKFLTDGSETICHLGIPKVREEVVTTEEEEEIKEPEVLKQKEQEEEE